MKVSSERIEGCQLALTIEAEPEEMEKALEKAYRRLVNRVVVPGFRKGKAPRHMLERHIGHESMVTEALDHLVPELYEQAIKEQGIEALGQPQLEVVQPEPPIFKAIVPLKPVVELGDYCSVKVIPEVVEIPDDEVEESMKNLRHSHASWEPVEREARLGDMVALDVTATTEGNTVLEKNGTTYRITEGSVSPVPGFAEKLVEMNAGEEKEFTLPFPEDYPSTELAGKDCLFKVSISEIKEERLPELNDEFVKSLNQDLETLEQLRERMANNLKAVAEREMRGKLESQAIEAAIGVSKVEFPEALVEHEVNRMGNDQLMRMGGITLEAYLGYRGVTEDEFRNELRPMAEKRVRNSLVLSAICEAEKIEVTDSDVDTEVERMLQDVREHGDQEDQSAQMREWFSSPQARESLRGELLTRKTIDRLVEIATVKEGTSEEENAVSSDAGAG
ncbi:MAG: trigger factor, partial [Dehalococcoidia bacterium]|nr:trigger factor [Dehalococcoidia bacterium]